MTLTRLLATAGLATALLAGPTFAQDMLRFAVVPKAMNNPFFDFARDGCVDRAAELGNIECVYIGPVEHEPATQAQIVEDLITQGIDGLAISVADEAAATTVIQRAIEAGIPVITFDSDAPDSGRTAYIGTNNYDFGQALGEMLLERAPDGGTYGMISGGAAAPNLADRVNGVRDALAGSNWTEVQGSPTFCNDDSALAVQQANDLVTANPDIGAIVPVGGWPMFAPEGWKNFVDNAPDTLELVVADTLPSQLEMLSEGYADALVGQRPYEEGQVAMDTLLAIHNGEAVDEIIYTGLDRVTQDNVADFM